MKKTLVSVLSAAFLSGFVVGCQPGGSGATEHSGAAGVTHSTVHGTGMEATGETHRTTEGTHR